MNTLMRVLLTAVAALMGLVAFAAPAAAEGDAPAKPQSVNVEHNDIAAMLTWDRRSDATTYVWLQDSDAPQCSGSYRGDCFFFGLTPATTYMAHVFAEDDEGRRSGDVWLTFTTDPAIARPSPARDVAAKFTETGSLLINWSDGDFDGSAVAWNSDGEVVGRCSVLWESSCEIAEAYDATKVGVHECQVPWRGNISPRLEPYCTDHEVAQVLDGLAMPAPLVPADVKFVDLSPEGPIFAWTHPGGNASTYVAWIDAPYYYRNECRVEVPFEPVVACTIERLITTGLVYEVHFYAVNDDGRTSPTVQLSVEILEAPPVEPAPTEPEPEAAESDSDRCASDGKHERKRQRSLDRIERKYTKATEKWSDRLEERPKKLAKRMKRLENNRTRRIARVDKVYESACSEDSTQSMPAVSPGYGRDADML